MDIYEQYFETEECFAILMFLGVQFIDDILNHHVFAATRSEFIKTMKEVFELGNDPFDIDPFENSYETNMHLLMMVCDKLGVDQDV